MDFTFSVYKHLLVAVQPCGYSFQTFADFIQSPKKRTIILRHDVDRLPDNALQMARLEHEAGIAATYYFRAVLESWDESIIREIASLGHEIGYHYENLSEISKGERVKRKQNRENSKEERGKGKEEIGISKEETAKKEREGREWDFLWKARMNRMIGWKQLNMKRGNRKEKLVIRKQDRENRNEELGIRKKTMNEKLGLRFRYTWDIIEAAERGLLPDKVMLNVHPQRWDDKPWPWIKEFVGQNFKNVIKRAMLA